MSPVARFVLSKMAFFECALFLERRKWVLGRELWCCGSYCILLSGCGCREEAGSMRRLIVFGNHSISIGIQMSTAEVCRVSSC